MNELPSRLALGAPFGHLGVELHDASGLVALVMGRPPAEVAVTAKSATDVDPRGARALGEAIVARYNLHERLVVELTRYHDYEHRRSGVLPRHSAGEFPALCDVCELVDAATPRLVPGGPRGVPSALNTVERSVTAEDATRGTCVPNSPDGRSVA